MCWHNLSHAIGIHKLQSCRVCGADAVRSCARSGPLDIVRPCNLHHLLCELLMRPLFNLWRKLQAFKPSSSLKDVTLDLNLWNCECAAWHSSWSLGLMPCISFKVFESPSSCQFGEDVHLSTGDFMERKWKAARIFRYSDKNLFSVELSPFAPRCVGITQLSKVLIINVWDTMPCRRGIIKWQTLLLCLSPEVVNKETQCSHATAYINCGFLSRPFKLGVFTCLLWRTKTLNWWQLRVKLLEFWGLSFSTSKTRVRQSDFSPSWMLAITCFEDCDPPMTLGALK